MIPQVQDRQEEGLISSYLGLELFWYEGDLLLQLVAGY